MIIYCCTLLLIGIVVGLLWFSVLYTLENQGNIRYIRNLSEVQISRIAKLANETYDMPADEVIITIEACYCILFNKDINIDQKTAEKAINILKAISGFTEESDADISDVIHTANSLLSQAYTDYNYWR